MRSIPGIIIFVLLSMSTLAQQKPLSIIPYPFEVKQTDGFYTCRNKMTVSSQLPSQEWQQLFSYFRNEMRKQFNIELEESKKEKADIRFELKRMPTGGGLAYELNVDKSGITIISNFDESAFHGIQTVLQLLPVEPKEKNEIPFVHIFDKPRFSYRGMHLDVCRHFFPVAFVKQYIDWLAYHKMNIFHWHLTDDQGWRIEIKKYPNLTKTGAWRNGTIIGRYPGKGNDEILYGGFYTQEDIKDVVEYARQRFVEIIPEIEMPGHSSAAIAAYPWLSCYPEKPTPIPANMISKKSIEEQKNGRIKLVQETWGVFDDVYCAGKDSTFMFLQDVVDEVAALFPSKYFHMGGDESPKTQWKTCPRCQQRIKDNHLKDEHELQSYFVQRMEKYVNSKGKTLIGWDEILEGGLAPNAVVMSWRGTEGGIDAAKQNHDVIMTPGNPVYFDHSQAENEDSVTIGGYNPIENVYAYEPVPAVLTEDQGKHIIGAQANLWTEYIGNTSKIEYMLFPRIEALSEILWSPKENRNWNSFEPRLLQAMEGYDKNKINYSKAYFDLKTSILATPDNKGVLWKLESKFRDSHILYMNEISPLMEYKQPVTVKRSGTYDASLYNSQNKMLASVKQKFSFNLATGKNIQLAELPSSKYPGDGAFTLVNGVINEQGMGRSREFIAFNGGNCEAIIDLGNAETVKDVTVNSLDQKSSWIWRPQRAEVLVSTDGKQWTSLKTTDDFVPSATAIGKGTMTMNFSPVEIRYIKVVISNWGTIPDGYGGAGSKAWLFVDEIEVK